MYTTWGKIVWNKMPVLPEDAQQYQNFITERIKALGCLEYDREAVLWHYTTTPGLLGIIESGTIHATQVACLSDSSEIRYAGKLYRDALTELQHKHSEEDDAKQFLSRVLEATAEIPDSPSHGPSRFFVACFSIEEDDLSQWRAYGEPGGENGYALGFRARGLADPYGALLRVNYDKIQHKTIAAEVAEATLRFYREGIEKKRADTAEVWAKEFLEEWINWINRLAPLVKDSCFKDEREFRLVHELNITEFHQIRFKQKETLLSRFLPIGFPAWLEIRAPFLPLVKVMVGPGRHQAITQISVHALLKQMGYGDFPVSLSQRPLQRP
jgi:Protein of unknown function (DUF2971)